MVKIVQQVAKLILLIIAGVGGTVIIGLMVYGTEVFSPTSIGFSFVSFGLSGACIFAFYHVRGLSETITAAVVVSTVQFVFLLAFITMLNAGIWSFGVNLPIILLAFLFERKLAPLKRLKFVAVAVLYGAMFVLLTLIVALVTGVVIISGAVFRQNFVDGLLIGLGLGIGIQGGEAFIDSLEQHSHKHPEPVEKQIS